ncbi:MAG TPA: outer membrane beta-barrel protein [Gemmatimonadaceae bacterium]
MFASTRRLTLTALMLTVAAAMPLAAQQSSERQGFWFNLGLGTGSFGCSDCGDRVNGFSGGLAIGGTINEHVLLGAFTNGWTKSEDGATLSAGTLVAGVRVYPSKTNGFFLLGGLGIATIDVDLGPFSGSEQGTGGVLGLGWDIRVAPGFSLTPYWNGIGMKLEGETFNVAQFGLGLTIH